MPTPWYQPRWLITAVLMSLDACGVDSAIEAYDDGESGDVDAISEGGLELLPGNLLTNPSFESGTAGWHCYNCTVAAISSSVAPNGTRIGRVTRATGTDFSVGDWPGTQSTAAAQTFSAVAFVRAGSSNAASTIGKKSSICLRERDAAGAFVATQCGTPVALGTAYVPVRVDYTARASGRLDLFVYLSGGSGTDAFSVDAVSLVKGALPPSTPTPTPTPSPTPSTGSMGPPPGSLLVRDLSLRSAWTTESGANVVQLAETGPGGDPVLRNTVVDGQAGASSGVPSERSDLQGGAVPLESTRWMVWYERFTAMPTTTLDRWQLIGPCEIHGQTLDQATVMPEVGPDKRRRLNANAGRPTTRYFDVGPIEIGRWYQMKFGVHYTQSGTGWLELWRDGLRMVRFDGATTTEARNGYWKFANYRNAQINGQSVYDVSGVRVYQPAQ